MHLTGSPLFLSTNLSHNTSNDHALRVEDVEFRMSDGVFVQSHKLRSGKKHVNPVKVMFQHCEKDPFRHGNSFLFNRKEVDGLD